MRLLVLGLAFAAGCSGEAFTAAELSAAGGGGAGGSAGASGGKESGSGGSSSGGDSSGAGQAGEAPSYPCAVGTPCLHQCIISPSLYVSRCDCVTDPLGTPLCVNECKAGWDCLMDREGETVEAECGFVTLENELCGGPGSALACLQGKDASGYTEFTCRPRE